MNAKKREFLAALLTPFDDQGKFCPGLLEGLIEHNISQGIHGLYVGGTTGEWPAMNLDERLELFRVTADIVGKRIRLFAHVGALATRDACSLAEAAGRHGYDVISAVPPFYNDYSSDDIALYYANIMKHSDLPMVLYYIPSRTGGKFDVAFLEEISRSERVYGIKFTDMNLFLMERVLSRVRDKYLYFGCDEMVLSGLAAGANGGIGSTYNFMGPRILQIAAALDRGDFETARRQQRVVNDVIEVLFKVGLIAGLKYMLRKIGVDCGVCRRPLGALNGDQLAALDRIFEAERRA